VIRLGLLCGALGFATPALGSGVDALGQVGAGTAFPPNGSGASRMTGHLGAAVLVPFRPDLSFGLRARLHLVDAAVGGILGGNVLGLARLSLGTGRLRPYLGAGGGIGAWTACVAGDYCGGMGPVGNVEVGAQWPSEKSLRLVASLDLTAQTGMVNGVGVLLIPTLSLGLLY
jgi:hypothetical protein